MDEPPNASQMFARAETPDPLTTTAAGPAKPFAADPPSASREPAAPSKFGATPPPIAAAPRHEVLKQRRRTTHPSRSPRAPRHPSGNPPRQMMLLQEAPGGQLRTRARLPGYLPAPPRPRRKRIPDAPMWQRS